jgi:DNA segregation ATPase FtsK/SpoIIIE, S-DNA-T family
MGHRRVEFRVQLSLMRNDSIYRLPLPAKVSGQVRVPCGGSDGSECGLIGVEGVGGDWVLKSNRRAWVLEGQHRVREAWGTPTLAHD